MFTLAGFYDATQHDDLAAVDAIPDPYLKVSGDDLYIPSQNRLMAVVAEGQNISQCRLQSPSLRRMANQRIVPVNATVTPVTADRMRYFQDLKEHPRTLDIAEALNAYAINGGATDEFILVWLMDALAALPAGEIFTIESTVTAAVTLVLGRWVNGAVYFTQTLPAGRYAVVGMRPEDSYVHAARLVFPDVSQRPGSLGTTDGTYYNKDLFRYGRLGSWGEFEHDAVPTVDFLGNTAGARSPEVYFDLIQVRAGRA